MRKILRGLLLIFCTSSVAALHATASAEQHRSSSPSSPVASQKPNIVYILCDDLGYGDVRCLNPERSKIETPHCDTLARQGMVFTQAHSSSSVCTPSRYSILTGRYAWRTRLQFHVLGGTEAPLIASDRLTVPALLKQHGYTTACVGKWHLGMSIDLKKKDAPAIHAPPTHFGFQTFFGLSASLDTPPFAYIRNAEFVEAPTVTKTFGRTGPAAPSFEAVDVLPKLTAEAVEVIRKAKAPFFLYLPLTSPHTPIVPGPEWQGKSSVGPYGDFVMQTDWVLGQIMRALDEAGVSDNTLLVFTSDNGFAPYVGVQPSGGGMERYKEIEKLGHYPSADRRGYKSDIWDGGHRIPLIIRWPARIKPGSTCDQLVSLTDFMATCADILGTKLPDQAGEDSVSMLPALLGTDGKPLREAVVYHSIHGSFAIQQGRWKLGLCPDSGGWSAPRRFTPEAKALPATQLYDMQKDIGERRNESESHPEVVAQLSELLKKYVDQGRSTPGAPQKNDVKVEIIKSEKEKVEK
jgi:arylsulfatase A